MESDSISVPARELGANVPRAKVFKPTKPLRSNQSKDRANQVVNNTAPVSETVDRREGCVDCTVEDVMDVSIEANTTIESVDSPRSDLAATIDVNVIIETDSTASSSSVAEDVQEEDVVAMEVDSSACIVQDSMLRQTSTNVGCDPVDLDSNVNRFSQVISSKTVASSNGMAEAKNKLSPILSPNEPVFSGKMVYPPLFCFWQVSKYLGTVA
ncbi:hypothetical protein EON65_16550 [archaeon]|nr:MAG: hypothetical protein EON65_16550 [archaeon]